MRYAISDIHGCAKTFRYLVKDLFQLKPTDELFLLGDYIDRGPDSKGVIDYIMELKEAGYKVRTLTGNHEAMMLDALEDTQSLLHWKFNGGRQTLASFGVAGVEAIPEKYWQFIQQLEYYIELEDYILVHAGLNFAAANPLTDTESMLWIRDFPVDETYLGQRRLVHGHTPTSVYKIEQNILNKASVLNIDTGCVYMKRMQGLGYLTGLNLDTFAYHFVPNQD